MQKPIVSSVLALLLVLLLVLSGVAAGKWASAYQQLKVEAQNLRLERDTLLAKVKAAESLPYPAAESGPNSAELPTPTTETNSLDLIAVRPRITTDARGRKTYVFTELYSANNGVIARDAKFEELLGFTKLAFRTPEGVRYYDIDDLHPEVVRSLGYDAAVLKRRLAEEARQRQILGAQAQLQAELRAKTAFEVAEREKATAERLKAEAALRDAEARERLAEAAERAATNPPKPQRITQKVIVTVPYDSKIITNSAPPSP